MSTATETKVKQRAAQNIVKRSTLSDQRRVSNVSFSSKPNSFSNKPTPKDFDLFLPWICKEMEVPNSVIVIAMAQEKQYRASGGSAKSKTANCGKGNKIFNILMKQDEISLGNKSSDATINNSATIHENFVPITAYYDSSGHLVEISIVDCTLKIPKQVLQAISFCFPFHAFFTKLSICKGGLYCSLLNEIGKMLPYSHITDVCVDDSFVPEGNYYVLLDRLSHLKHLSMSRCSITDDVCEKIFLRLKYGCPAEKFIMILNFSSNHITDIGAKSIGDVLRENRHLLHLNLSGNKITDTGLDYILRPLAEFPLTYDEIMGSKRRYLEYCKRKIQVYSKCLKEIEQSLKTSVIFRASRTEKSKDKKKEMSKKIPDDDSSDNIFLKAEKNALEIVGEFQDLFDSANTIRRDNYLYSVGNLKLCSLNMSYNRLEFISLKKIIEVLIYQNTLDMKSPNTGLMRMILDGNLLPQFCDELDIIQEYLRRAVKTQELFAMKSTVLKRKTHYDKLVAQ